MLFGKWANMMECGDCKRVWCLRWAFNSYWIFSGELAGSWNCKLKLGKIFRLGIYDTAVALGWTKTRQGNQSFWLSYFWGGLGGCAGSCAGSPFFLVKTHLQPYTKSEIAVGYQRNHDGMIHAFRKIYTARGIRGLYRGVIGNIPRAALGSGAQLATFGPTKDFLHRHNLSFQSSIVNSFVCGAFAGSTMAVAITPPDIILTRLYNQPLDEQGRGKYYNGVIDCFWKVLKTEGVQGLYKGFWPNYFRIAPHSTLVLLFYDEAKLLRDKYCWLWAAVCCALVVFSETIY